MYNVVSLQPDRPRPPRDLAVPRGGARILFFTGVRYCRDEAEPQARHESRVLHCDAASVQRLDAAAH